MIWEAIYGGLINCACALFDLLPNVDVSFMDGWNYIKDILIDIFTGLGCLIPFASLMPLLACQMSLWGFRLIYAIILRLKSFLPLLGGT